MQGQQEDFEGQPEQQEAPALEFLYKPFFECLEDVDNIVRDVEPKTRSIEAALQARGPDLGASASAACM
jgi:hypothetical protein